MRLHHTLAIAVTLLVLSGCTVALTPRTINVPPNLSTPDVETAIIASLTPPPPEQLNAREQITDRALNAVLRRYRSVEDFPSNTWFPESVAPGMVEAGYKRGEYYLRAAIQFDDRTVNLRVIDSRNLRQNGDRIHKTAVVWLDSLDTQIRRALGQKSAEKAVEAQNRR